VLNGWHQKGTIQILVASLAGCFGGKLASVADKGKAEQLLPGIGPSSIVHETIKAFRKIGLLVDIIDTKEGLVVYPVEMMREVGDTN
jgi:hypothetical protein